MSVTPLVFLDTETTGVHPGRKVWEVAMIRRDESSQKEIQFFVSVDLRDADPFGLKVGGFYDRHPVGRKIAGQDEGVRIHLRYPDEAAQNIARWTHGAHIVGAVPNFDTETLAPLLREHGFTPGWHYHLIDVENLAVGFLAGQGERIDPPWRSDDLTEALGLPPVPESERHTALGDAKWAMRVYDRIMADDS